MNKSTGHLAQTHLFSIGVVNWMHCAISHSHLWTVSLPIRMSIIIVLNINIIILLQYLVIQHLIVFMLLWWRKRREKIRALTIQVEASVISFSKIIITSMEQHILIFQSIWKCCSRDFILQDKMWNNISYLWKLMCGLWDTIVLHPFTASQAVPESCCQAKVVNGCPG